MSEATHEWLVVCGSNEPPAEGWTTRRHSIIQNINTKVGSGSKLEDMVVWQRPTSDVTKLDQLSVAEFQLATAREDSLVWDKVRSVRHVPPKRNEGTPPQANLTPLNVYRTRVPGGWLVDVDGSVVYVPDELGEWNARTMD